MSDFEFMTLEQGATKLGLDKMTLLRAIKQGQLQATRLGRGFKTKEEWLQAYVDSLTVNIPKREK